MWLVLIGKEKHTVPHKIDNHDWEWKIFVVNSTSSRKKLSIKDGFFHPEVVNCESAFKSNGMGVKLCWFAIGLHTEERSCGKMQDGLYDICCWVQVYHFSPSPECTDTHFSLLPTFLLTHSFVFLFHLAGSTPRWELKWRTLVCQGTSTAGTTTAWNEGPSCQSSGCPQRVWTTTSSMKKVTLWVFCMPCTWHVHTHTHTCICTQLYIHTYTHTCTCIHTAVHIASHRDFFWCVVTSVFSWTKGINWQVRPSIPHQIYNQCCSTVLLLIQLCRRISARILIECWQNLSTCALC